MKNGRYWWRRSLHWQLANSRLPVFRKSAFIEVRKIDCILSWSISRSVGKQNTKDAYFCFTLKIDKFLFFY
jgi:hypothetical protein